MKHTMKQMVSALLLAAVLLLTLCACGSNSAGSSTASSATAASADKLNTITNGVLTLATSADFPPYEYYEGDTITGIDVEIAQAIADKLGLTLQIEDMDFNTIVAAIQNGKYDIGMAGLTVNEDRSAVVDFTDSYATGIQAILVPEDSPITSVDDLLNNIGTYKIGVQLSTTGDIYACDDFGSENVEEYTKGADAVLALTTGKIDAVIIDKEPAKSFAAANTGLKLLDTDYTVEDYAIIVQKGNSALKDAINKALAALKEDGTIQAIIDKYITTD